MANASDSIKSELKKLESEVDKDPKNYIAHMEIAEYYRQLGNIIEAFSWLNKANKRFPNEIGPYLELGKIFIQREMYHEALRMYEKATEIESTDYRGWIGIANISEHYNETEELVNACIAARDAAPEDPEALTTVLHCLVRANELERAEGLIKKIRIIPNIEENYSYKTDFYQAFIYLKQKLFKKAIDILEKIPADSCKYPISLHNIALSYSDLKEFDKSEMYFKKALEFDEIKSNPHVWVNYGLMFEKSKKYENALKAYNQANELQPDIWPWVNHMKAIFIDKVPPPENHKNLQQVDTKMVAGDTKQLDYSLYLGCVIPNRYPVIEAATRLFMDEMGVKLKEMDGASCCPAPGVFRSFDIPTWLTIAARNISIGEKNESDILTLCNGCYGTLLEADHKLKHQSDKKNMVNEHLKKIRKEYKGSIKVKHIIEAMYYDIGKDKLKEHFVKKWRNLPVAVHYGCHILKPSDTKPWGAVSEEPRFFDELVNITGARSIFYKDKNMCCGAGGAVRTAVKEVSLDFTREKLENVRNVGGQAIITCCPFCHLQYDLGQVEINGIFKDQIEEAFQIPVVYVTQLFDYAYGKDPYSIGLLRPDQPAGTPPFTDNSPLFETFLD